MNREFLESLGLEKEKIDEIMKAHGKSVQSAKPSDYDDIKSAHATLQQQINDLTATNQSLNEKTSEYENEVNDWKTKATNYEKTNNQYRVASQVGIPLELASRLQGDTEEDLKADAEKLSSFMSKPEPMPLKPSEPTKTDPEIDAYKSLVQNLKLEGE